MLIMWSGFSVLRFTPDESLNKPVKILFDHAHGFSDSRMYCFPSYLYLASSRKFLNYDHLRQECRESRVEILK